MQRVGQYQLEITLQDVPYRLPVNPGRFHRHVSAACLPQPLRQLQQSRGGGRKAPHLLAHLTTVSLCTSKPAHRLWIASTADSFTTLPAGSPLHRTLPNVLANLPFTATIQGARRASGQTNLRAASTKSDTDLCAGSAVFLYYQSSSIRVRLAHSN